jgi:hypothetical protein
MVNIHNGTRDRQFISMQIEMIGLGRMGQRGAVHSQGGHELSCSIRRGSWRWIAQRRGSAEHLALAESSTEKDGVNHCMAKRVADSGAGALLGGILGGGKGAGIGSVIGCAGGLGTTAFHGHQRITPSSGQEMLIRLTGR